MTTRKKPFLPHTPRDPRPHRPRQRPAPEGAVRREKQSALSPASLDAHEEAAKSGALGVGSASGRALRSPGRARQTEHCTAQRAALARRVGRIKELAHRHTTSKASGAPPPPHAEHTAMRLALSGRAATCHHRKCTRAAVELIRSTLSLPLVQYAQPPSLERLAQAREADRQVRVAAAKPSLREGPCGSRKVTKGNALRLGRRQNGRADARSPPPSGFEHHGTW